MNPGPPRTGREADLAEVARRIAAPDSDGADAPEQLAARIHDACEALVGHLARVIGETGVRALFRRSVDLAGAEFPWLHDDAGAPPAPWTSALARRDADTAVRAFAAVLSTFAALLARLIGDGLATRLLEEAWPAALATPEEEAT